ncbi:MAG: DUF5683 domain-containing protein [Bacteroidales bacterium]|nr:DUF5683 domain-containing protein [Bacteroidales bacterium]
MIFNFQNIVKAVLFALLCLVLPGRGMAQGDTLVTAQVREQRVVSPLKATMIAAAFPGLGQVYNRKYWKIPLVYAGFGAVGYSIVFNTSNFNSYLKGYQDLTDEIPETNSYIKLLGKSTYTPGQIDQALGSDEFDAQVSSWVEDQLRNAIDYYRRYRDLSYIGVAVWYLITIIDAHVDANLADYDVGESLRMEIEPVPVNTPAGNGMGLGVKLTF